ncbi:Inner spore coat protein H [Enhygromyxa salina]|uniref:Inner spore coat protein H n=1 Tax=Enhygromyxa salina TaxID=215803 RepID=A0A2S9XYT1_9BACT|nr:CotH kinase family protein [Enhygromyxa salina]PRP97900.1 Inner spore coat protein H [Enhygromyxa salina]
MTKSNNTISRSFAARFTLLGPGLLLLGCPEAPPDIDPGPGTGSDGIDISDSDTNSNNDASTTETEDGADADETDDGETSSGPSPKPPPDPDASANLFSHDYLPVYRVTMQGANWPEAWDHLMTQISPDSKCDARPFSEADVAFENPWSGETEFYDDVGFRIRGHDLPEQILAQPDERYGFKMSFVRYTPGRRFHGHKRINFLSSERDDTLMKQCLVYELLRDFNIPAPRCNFAGVYVNDDYVGVFAHVEERDDRSYAKNRFPDDPDGSLYEFGDCWGDEEDALADLGPDLEPYLDTYQLEAGTDEVDMLSDLIPFMHCASAPDQDFVPCIEDHIHLDEWHRAMAAHFAISDMDGWAPSSANFLLYHYGPEDTPRRFVIFPWDVDRAFKDDCYKNDDEGNNHTGPCHILGRIWEDGASPELVNRLREPPFRSEFCAAAEAFVEQYFNPEAVSSRVSDLRQRPRLAAKPFEGLAAPSLNDLIKADPLWDYERFVDGVEEITGDKVPDRHAALLDQIAECELSPLVDN